MFQDEREAREQIKLEQEQAYQESLEADRAKSLVRRAEEEEQRALEKAALEERMRQEDERRQEEQQKAVGAAVMRLAFFANYGSYVC